VSVGSKGVGKLLGCAAIAVAALVTLGLSVHHDVRFTASVTTPKFIAENHAQMAGEECIYNAIRSDVPKGATVYTGGQHWPYMQRLDELSTLWAVPQANRADAQYQLTLVKGNGPCDGLTLKVRRI
jgi:hypothetical protein